MTRIVVESHLTDDLRAAILAPLDRAGREAGITWSPQPLILALRESAGTVVGGLIGDTNLGWLYVDTLAVVEDLRGQSWGSRLLARAEAIAIERGCRHAWLNTFSFQARPFYERHGYVAFGELEDFPPGQSRIFLRKDLTPTTG